MSHRHVTEREVLEIVDSALSTLEVSGSRASMRRAITEDLRERIGAQPRPSLVGFVYKRALLAWEARKLATQAALQRAHTRQLRQWRAQA